MTYFVDIKDKRNEFVFSFLKEQNFDVKKFEEGSEICEFDSLIFSPAKKFNLDEIQNFPNKIKIFAGNLEENALKILKEKQIKYINLLSDETLAVKNAGLTSEAVLAILIQNTQKSIYDCKILILGGGRVATALFILFGKLGLDFSVVSFNEEKFETYFAFSNKCYFGNSFSNDLENFDVIINTIPAQIFQPEWNLKLKKSCIFIETASQNSLVSKEGVNYIVAPGLPGKFSPESAGELIFEKILKEEKVNEN